jgi:hypothetical protein
MRGHVIAAAAFVLIISGVLAARGETPAPFGAPDPARLGPKVGERVADFTLPDQQGAARPLRSMLGPKGAVLVFFRSADW